MTDLTKYQVLESPITYKKLVLLRLAYGVAYGEKPSQEALTKMMEADPALREEVVPLFHNKTLTELTREFADLQKDIAADPQYDIGPIDRALMESYPTTVDEVRKTLDLFKGKFFPEAGLNGETVDLAAYVKKEEPAPPRAPPVISKAEILDDSSPSNIVKTGFDDLYSSPAERRDDAFTTLNSAAIGRNWGLPLPAYPTTVSGLATPPSVVSRVAKAFGKPLPGTIEITPDKIVHDYMAEAILYSDKPKAALVREITAKVIADKLLMEKNGEERTTLRNNADAMAKAVAPRFQQGVKDFITAQSSDPAFREEMIKELQAEIQSRAPTKLGEKLPAWQADLQKLASSDFKKLLNTPLYKQVEAGILRTEKPGPRRVQDRIAANIAKSTEEEIKSMRENFLPYSTYGNTKDGRKLSEQKAISNWVKKPFVGPSAAANPISRGIFETAVVMKKMPDNVDYRDKIRERFFSDLDKEVAEGFKAIGIDEVPAGVKKWRDNLEAMAKTNYAQFLKQDVGMKQVMVAALNVKPNTAIARVQAPSIPAETMLAEAKPSESATVQVASLASVAPSAPVARSEPAATASPPPVVISPAQRQLAETRQRLEKLIPDPKRRVEYARLTDTLTTQQAQLTQAETQLSKHQESIAVKVNKGMQESFLTPPGMSPTNPMGMSGIISRKTIAAFDDTATVIMGGEPYDLSKSGVREKLTTDAAANYKTFIEGHIVATKHAAAFIKEKQMVAETQRKINGFPAQTKTLVAEIAKLETNVAKEIQIAAAKPVTLAETFPEPVPTRVASRAPIAVGSGNSEAALGLRSAIMPTSHSVVASVKPPETLPSPPATRITPPVQLARAGVYKTMDVAKTLEMIRAILTGEGMTAEYKDPKVRAEFIRNVVAATNYKENNIGKITKTMASDLRGFMQKQGKKLIKRDGKFEMVDKIAKQPLAAGEALAQAGHM